MADSDTQLCLVEGTAEFDVFNELDTNTPKRQLSPDHPVVIEAARICAACAGLEGCQTDAERWRDKVPRKHIRIGNAPTVVGKMFLSQNGVRRIDVIPVDIDMGIVNDEIKQESTESKTEQKPDFAEQEGELDNRKEKWVITIGEESILVTQAELDALRFACARRGEEFSVAELRGSGVIRTSGGDVSHRTKVSAALNGLMGKLPEGLLVRDGESMNRRYKLEETAQVGFENKRESVVRRKSARDIIERVVEVVDTEEDDGPTLAPEETSAGADDKPNVAVVHDGARNGAGKNHPEGSGNGSRREFSERSTKRDSVREDEDIIRIYLTDIGQYPLLEKSDEVDLAKLIEAGKEATEMLDKHPRISSDKKRELQRKVRAGKDAEDRFTRSNLRLVVSIARKYQYSGMPLLDLIQEGNLGLMHAVEKFDHRKGFKFSTYGTWWIRQAITRGIANSGRVIRLPVHAGDMLATIQKARNRLEAKLGRNATIQEIALETELSVDKIVEAMDYSRNPISLDEPVGEDSDSTFGDLLADRNAIMPDEEVEKSLLPAMISEALSNLGEREREIIRMRFGLDGGEPRTLEDVGEQFNVSRERIRQIEARAMTKLRHPSSPARKLFEGLKA